MVLVGVGGHVPATWYVMYCPPEKSNTARLARRMHDWAGWRASIGVKLIGWNV